MEKEDFIKSVTDNLITKDFKIADQDLKRPWGAFFVIDSSQTQKFINTFFPELNPNYFEGYNHLSPKILIVEPNKRLSWQYHHRRAEIWKVINGLAGVVRSETDELNEVEWFSEGSLIEIPKGMRHRLVGSKDWCVIAEIWKHTQIDHPSDEEDIVRVEDDFGR